VYAGLVPLGGAPERLRRRRGERPPKQPQQLAAFCRGQPPEDVVLDVSRQGPRALHGSAPSRRDHDLARAPVGWMRSPLREAGALELVDQRDHRAGIDPHRRSDLLLNRRVSRPKKAEHCEKRGRQADRLERRGGLRVRGAPEAEEQLAGELGDLGVVWRWRAGRHQTDTCIFDPDEQ
jgi:hypothetical protein